MSNTSGVALADAVGFMNDAIEQQEHEEQRTFAASSQVAAATAALLLSPTGAAYKPVPLYFPLPDVNNNGVDAIYNFTSEANQPLCLPKKPTAKRKSELRYCYCAAQEETSCRF
jgi:hypothetical protein